MSSGKSSWDKFVGRSGSRRALIRAPDRKDILINREVNELLLEPLSIAKRVLLYQGMDELQLETFVGQLEIQ